MVAGAGADFVGLEPVVGLLGGMNRDKHVSRSKTVYE